MKKAISIGLSILLLSTFLSCKTIFLTAYGIKSEKFLTDDQIIALAHKHKFDQYSLAKLKDDYKQFLLQMKKDTSANLVAPGNTRYASSTAHDMGQPLQYMLFNKDDQLISYFINCYAKGFPNLKWNKGGIFDVFPPRSQSPIDTAVSWSSLQAHFIWLTPKQTGLNSNYTCVVYWDHLMGRQSRRLIKTVLRNYKTYDPKESIHLVFVNNDNYFYEKSKK